MRSLLVIRLLRVRDCHCDVVRPGLMDMVVAVAAAGVWQQAGAAQGAGELALQQLEAAAGAANVLLLAPDWSSWQLPTLSEEEATAARRVKPEPGPGPPQLLTHTHSSDTTLGSQLEASGGSGSGQDTGQTSTGQAPGSRQLAQPGGAEAGSSSAPQVRRTPHGCLDIVMDSCMRHEVQVKGGRPLLPQHLAAAAPRMLSSLRDAAHLAQGFYVSANPTAGLPVAAELGVSALDSLASEMLLRGVAWWCVVGAELALKRGHGMDEAVLKLMCLEPWLLAAELAA
ncbi:hypothetical protein HaLaN_24350 [Haematococcus lacustris]|uniref:Uncharacterized protein n=1 Tax=Haematococcus lacustris TaxID=44745 RepID=A0A6A0A397_HAELA|nr:hypothetical protein HaLaN_24350 [Haematococcus lacustris]